MSFCIRGTIVEKRLTWIMHDIAHYLLNNRRRIVKCSSTKVSLALVASTSLNFSYFRVGEVKEGFFLDRVPRRSVRRWVWFVILVHFCFVAINILLCQISFCSKQRFINNIFLKMMVIRNNLTNGFYITYFRSSDNITDLQNWGNSSMSY